MNQTIKNNQYKIISLIILVLTLLGYKATNLVTFAQKQVEKKFNVYSVEVVEIPVLKDNIKFENNLYFDEISKSSEATTGAQTTTGSQATSSAQTATGLQPIYGVDASGGAQLIAGAKAKFDINNLSSKAVYIEDVDTATKLFEKNGELLLLPASTTKIMTAMVVKDEFDLDQVLTVPDISKIEGYRVGLFLGEKLTVRELLKATLIQSSNDAAYVLALNHQDGLEGFVRLMNLKAKEFGLKDTIFENPAGFDAENQKTSAHDLVIMSKELMKDEFLRSVVGVKEEVITDSTGVYKHYLYNTHQLLGVDESVVGIKTGTTAGASEVLITQFNREGRNILIVVMESKDRYQETLNLIDWVFDSYVWLSPEQIIEKS